MYTHDPSLRIGVLRGGHEPGAIDSMKHGKALLKNLEKEHERVEDIFISPYGEWYWRGKAVRPEVALAHVDLVWNVLHNPLDSQVHRILALHRIRVIGERHLSSRLFAHHSSIQKHLERKSFHQRWFVVTSPEEIYREAERIVSSLMFPLRVTANAVVQGGGGVAWDMLELVTLLEEIVGAGQEAYVEEWGEGEGAVIFALRGFRGEEIYVTCVGSKRARSQGSGASRFAQSLKDLFIVSHASAVTMEVELILDERIAVQKIYPFVPWAHDELFDHLAQERGVTPDEVLHHFSSLA